MRRGGRGSARWVLPIVAASAIGLTAAVAAPRAAERPPTPHAPGETLMWVGVPAAGEAVQIDASSGRPRARLSVSAPGVEFSLGQTAELLVISEPTGTVTIVDASTLATRGRFPAGPDTTVLLNSAGLYVVDWRQGSIVRLDLANARPVGAAWTMLGTLADAGIDGAGTVWALAATGRLHRLVWTRGGLTDGQPAAPVPGAGPGSVLVPHDRGVTVVSPQAGQVARIGTGNDWTVPVLRSEHRAQRPASSPADLVPVALDGSPTLVLATGSGATLVDLKPYGCDQPGPPAVAAGRVFVPCTGVGRVVSLDASGDPALDTLALGPGDPDLVTDGSRLLATVAGAGRGIIVHADGSTVPVILDEPSSPVAALPTARATTAPATTTAVATTPPSAPADPQPPGPAPPLPSRPPPASGLAPPAAPTGVTATALLEGPVLVAWTPSTSTVDEYVVRHYPSAVLLARVPASATSATIEGLPYGDKLRVVVEASGAGGVTRSEPTTEVTVTRPPGAPLEVTVHPQRASGTWVEVRVTWTVTPGLTIAAVVGGRYVVDHLITEGALAYQTYELTLTTDRGTTSHQYPKYVGEAWLSVNCGASCASVTITAAVTLVGADYPTATVTGTATYRP